MPQPFNTDAQVVLKQARRLAESSDGLVILPMHLLAALVTDAPAVWNQLTHVDVHSLVDAVPGFEVQPLETTAASAALSNSGKRVLAYAMEEWFRARAAHLPPESVAPLIQRSEYVGPEFMLLGLMRESDSDAAQLLASHGLELEDVRRRFSDAPEP